MDFPAVTLEIGHVTRHKVSNYARIYIAVGVEFDVRVEIHISML